MSLTLMFIPFNPKTGRRTPYERDDFHEQLTRHGIDMPIIEEGSNFYSLELPQHGAFGGIEEEVMFLVEDDVVIGVTIEHAQAAGKALWLQLLQMGYIMQVASDEGWFVSPEWAAQNEQSGTKIPGIKRVTVIKNAQDFSRYKL